MITIGKRFSFDAAHRLGAHNGKCARPHGHTYFLELDFTGPLATGGSSGGMVIDYYHIKEMVEARIMAQFDHQDLNVVMRPYLTGDPEKENITTAENMLSVFVRIVREWLQCHFALVELTRVRLCETPSSWAEWRPDANV